MIYDAVRTIQTVSDTENRKHYHSLKDDVQYKVKIKRKPVLTWFDGKEVAERFRIKTLKNVTGDNALLADKEREID